MKFNQAILASRLGLFVQRDDWDILDPRDWITNIHEEPGNGFMTSIDAYRIEYKFPKSVAMEHEWRIRNDQESDTTNVEVRSKT